ncbi:Arginine metabolism regulation protein iii [Penicillium digitatum]|uniref:Kinase n=3 Tax=Penicillium digitatum TaxID=36651 RepID=K9G3J9_PEND2|nr:Arginine metabolism regulation protein iii [Penicillium digitatum Pd1]EKV10325.1 Arginine metabolism regulation protein iii [Penicillium digitatum Pd1]EKV15472.1 Arginine metabolism regulation protein iii [Penicillium digitatum PHI26]KAG0157445.1 hypothetical protein PDIDSM_4630 [Penicillium digitatum]QQK44229.1 Arginine metabolism regulation protein iii [Penicillium digitatum]
MPSKPEIRKTPQLGSEELVPFDHAAAGHEGVRCTTSGALIAKPCTRQEVEFYESSALHPAIQEFMPLYIGSLSSSPQQQPLAIAVARGSSVLPLPDSGDKATDFSLPAHPPSHTTAAHEDGAAPTKEEAAWVPSGGKEIDTGLSVVLENIACGFRRPNVLDVKLGARLWADDAPLEKRKKLDAVSMETTSSSLGYRIAGMKVWTGHNGETDEGDRTDPYATKDEGAEGERGEVIEKDGYRRYDKWYGRSFNKDNVKQGFGTFLAGAKAGKIDRSKMVAQRLARELKDLQLVIEAEESRMYSASVLVVYEGDIEAMERAIEEEQKVPAPRSQEDEAEAEDDDEFELPEETLELVNVHLGDGTPQQAINISIDPETMPLPDDDDDEEDEIPKVHALRLIDFAHASWTPGQGPDENLLKGVRSLVKVFEELAE